MKTIFPFATICFCLVFFSQPASAKLHFYYYVTGADSSMGNNYFAHSGQVLTIRGTGDDDYGNVYTGPFKWFKDTVLVGYGDSLVITGPGIYCTNYTRSDRVFIHYDGQLGPTGISEVKNTSSFSVYPNPFLSGLHISFNPSASSNLNLAIYNVAGEKIYSAELGRTDLLERDFDLSNLEAGIYFAILTSDNTRLVKSVVKNR